MGTKQSLPQIVTNAVEVRGETNLKLEAQKIKDFSCSMRNSKVRRANQD
jgi:hypothetical protein